MAGPLSVYGGSPQQNQSQSSGMLQQAAGSAAGKVAGQYIGKAMKNFNDGPAPTIEGVSGGAPVLGGEAAAGAGEAAGAAAGAGEAAGAGAAAADLAPLALLAL